MSTPSATAAGVARATSAPATGNARVRRRSFLQKLLDFVTFPIRAVLPWLDDRWNLTSRRSERFYEVAEEVRGYTLDIGCGPQDLFVRDFLSGNGRGIDVYPYDGLEEDQIVDDMTALALADNSFDSVTLIAALNHVPEPDRGPELDEMFRVLRPGGNLIVTMGHPAAEVAVHKMVELYDRYLGTDLDVDNERGMHHDESFFVRDTEIVELLALAGFRAIKKRSIWTQWGLNFLIVGEKPISDR